MIRPFAPHGLMAHLTPADTVAQTKAGQTVLAANYGAMRRLPTAWDPSAFTVFMEDFYDPVIATDALAGGWLTTVIGNGGVISASVGVVGGNILIISDDTAQYDGLAVQVVSGPMAPATGPIWYAVRFKCASAVTDYHARIGVAVTVDNTCLGGTLPKGIYWDIGTGAAGRIATRVVDHTVTLGTANVGTFVTDTWYEYSFHVKANGDVLFYIDRALVDTVTGAAWDTNLVRPFMAVQSVKASGLAHLSSYFDYVFWARAR